MTADATGAAPHGGAGSSGTGAVRTGASGALARMLPFLIAAVAYVIIGGVLAAATAYVTVEKTAWATAYIVLVGGVAQAGLGAALGWLAPQSSKAVDLSAFVLWNLGNIGVLVGQLAGSTVLTFVGGGLLVIALALVVVASVQGNRHRRPVHPIWLWAFRALVVILGVTIPIGLVLAALGQ